jgi:hypothetical protein
MRVSAGQVEAAGFASAPVNSAAVVVAELDRKVLEHGA